MNIAITADPSIPVPPVFYGGIERIIDLLITESSKQGHHFTLFAHKNSDVPCKLVPYKTEGNSIKDRILNTWTINKILLTQKFDIIHSFGRAAYLLPQLPAKTPKLISYQREPTISQVKKVVMLSQSGTLAFTGCSDYITNQIKPFADAFTVYNGVNINKYTATDKVADDAPLVFLGRIEFIKGTHTAIEIALKTNKKLKIAGNVLLEHQNYFNEKVKPFLNDQIEYIGPVNDSQKAKLLREGLALLMPIHWNEPFGIVMVEAMACGTPVIGFKRGAVPEVITQGLTGFAGHTIDELIGFVKMIRSIDRRHVRKMTELKFSSKIISDQYLEIYKNLIEKHIY